jgi:hypothetical protein
MSGGQFQTGQAATIPDNGKLTFGANYQSPVKPFPMKLSVPVGGISDKERDLQLAKLQRIGNAWTVKGKEFDVEKQMHTTHQKQFDAMGAAVKASTSFVKASTDWHNYQGAVADNRVARSVKNHAIAAISVEVEKHSVELEKKRASLEKSKLDLEQSLIANVSQRMAIDDGKELAEIMGTSVTASLPRLVPQIMKAELQYED